MIVAGTRSVPDFLSFSEIVFRKYAIRSHCFSFETFDIMGRLKAIGLLVLF